MYTKQTDTGHLLLHLLHGCTIRNKTVIDARKRTMDLEAAGNPCGLTSITTNYRQNNSSTMRRKLFNSYVSTRLLNVTEAVSGFCCEH